jgi:hypothetical protein
VPRRKQNASQEPPAKREEAPQGRVIERPDGFYWEAKETGEAYGPFPTLAEAEADMLSAGDGEVEAGETLQEAESELGISEWIDPDTGVPAEDSVPRIEDQDH